MRFFYYHVHSFFQHTSYRQINGDDPPIVDKCLTIVTRTMNLEKTLILQCNIKLIKISSNIID